MAPFFWGCPFWTCWDVWASAVSEFERVGTPGRACVGAGWGVGARLRAPVRGLAGGGADVAREGAGGKLYETGYLVGDGDDLLAVVCHVGCGRRGVSPRRRRSRLRCRRWRPGHAGDYSVGWGRWDFFLALGGLAAGNGFGWRRENLGLLWAALGCSGLPGAACRVGGLVPGLAGLETGLAGPSRGAGSLSRLELVAAPDRGVGIARSARSGGWTWSLLRISGPGR